MVMTDAEFKALTDLVADVNYTEKPSVLWNKASLIRRLIDEEITRREDATKS
jgi:hypothetical protein